MRTDRRAPRCCFTARERSCAHYPCRPLCKLKRPPNRPQTGSQAVADGRHRRRALAVRRARDRRRAKHRRARRRAPAASGAALDGRFCSIDGMPHFLSYAAAAHLLALADSFELVWASGWEEKANEHLPHLLGMPAALPFLRFPRGAATGERRTDPLEARRDRLLRRRAGAGLDRRRLQRGLPRVGGRAPRADAARRHRATARAHRARGAGAHDVGAGAGAPVTVPLTRSGLETVAPTPLDARLRCRPGHSARSHVSRLRRASSRAPPTTPRRRRSPRARSSAR